MSYEVRDKRASREHPRQAEFEATLRRLESEGRNPRVEIDADGRAGIVVDPLPPEPMEARRIASLTSNPTRKVDGINTLFSDRKLKPGEEFVPVNRKQSRMRLTTDDVSGRWTSEDE